MYTYLFFSTSRKMPPSLDGSAHANDLLEALKKANLYPTCGECDRPHPVEKVRKWYGVCTEMDEDNGVDGYGNFYVVVDDDGYVIGKGGYIEK